MMSSAIVALDLYRICQIEDWLDVRVDWLLGRSEVMEVPEVKTPTLGQPKR